MHCCITAHQGSVPGRSTLTNLLTDVLVAKAASHALDIIFLDFVKVFDKSPYSAVVEAAAKHSLCGVSLKRISSFLSGHIQQVCRGYCYSQGAEVESGAIPGLYTMIIISSLRKIHLPVADIANDITFTEDITIHTTAETQTEIDIVVNWAEVLHYTLYSEI